MTDPDNTLPSLNSHNQDDPRQQITHIARSARPPARYRYTEQDLARARNMQVLGIGIFIVSLPMFIVSWVAALAMVSIGVVIFIRFLIVEEETSGKIDTQGIFERQSNLYDFIANDQGMPTRYSPQVEAIKSIKEIELAKINNQHNAQMRDKDHSHEVIITDKTNQSDIRKTELMTDTQVRVAEIQANAQVKSAKWEAIGAGAEREHKESLEEKLRRWESREKDKDRTHEMDKLLERFDHELRMWKERIQVDYRAEPERMQEELDAWELEMAAREAIERETDEDAKIRKIKAFERRLYRRQA